MLKTRKELVEYVSHSAELRTQKSILNLAVLASLAGMFIAFGSVGNILVSADLYGKNAGIAKLLGASVFPVGLIAIVLLGCELFTSNCMMTIGFVEKKYSFWKMLKILGIVWVFNLVGALVVAIITAKTHTLGENGVKLLASMAHHKVEANALDIFLKGILCNVLVSTASLLGYIAKDGISKIFGIWFPIMLFIVLGYDHVVANMLYLPLAYIMGFEGVTIFGIIHNFLFATLGNFIGGGIVIALSLWYVNKN